jgi:Cu-Zn family superoxide dismutase
MRSARSRSELLSAPILALLSLAAGLAATGCAAGSGAGKPPAAPDAKARIEPRSDSQVKGSAAFWRAEGGLLRVHVEVQGAAPGQHGVHVHEKGDCSDPKALSVGGHFNPTGSAHHGSPTAAARHGGDLGNLVVGADGTGSIDVSVAGLTLDGAIDGVVGRAVIVHEKQDDLVTDPTGNSGARVGCGSIERAATSP